jgi:TolB-like protein/lipoprotein NlpI
LGDESPQRGYAHAGAIFLSYASQDAEAARKICASLRAGGLEVWFDQSELRGGDAWDQKIRREIRDCALFIPIVSQNTQERLEGYFRREWKLAVERTHDMAEQKPFLVPVVVDGTTDRDAIVPDLFRTVQWTRLPAGETPPSFVERVQRLLSPAEAVPFRGCAQARTETNRRTAQGASVPWRGVLIALAVVTFAAAAYFGIDRLRVSQPAVSPPTTSPGPANPSFNPPSHSIAVLPFVNLSGDKDQEYFSEGLTEELLNALTDITELQVAGRTSAFSFQGKDIDIGTIARKLNVAAILEGSVRRSGHTVRITAQLLNAVTGFHLWSKSYDRDLGDVLKLQSEIATAVASALKVTLLGNEAAKIELGGTRNPAAFDAYLRASRAARAGQGASSYQDAIDGYTEAIRLDPDYALAYAGRSLALSYYAGEFANGTAIRDFSAKSQADAHQALKLTPELADAHLALARFLASTPLDYTHANQAYQKALALAPGDAQVLAASGLFAVYMGRFETGLSAVRHAVALDPLNARTRAVLAESLFWARHYAEAIAVYGEVISLEPDFKRAYGLRGVAYYWLGDFNSALRSCQSKPEHWSSMWCLALTYDKLGRRADADAQLAKMYAAFGDNSAYQCATIYAARGDTADALEWLTKAVRLPDPGLVFAKTDQFMDPLRSDPRFQAIVRQLRFPD